MKVKVLESKVTCNNLKERQDCLKESKTLELENKVNTWKKRKA
jgi:hypothetical protein